jgi:hypothetical protein
MGRQRRRWEDNMEINPREENCRNEEMEGTGSGLCPVSGFSAISVTRVLC